VASPYVAHARNSNIQHPSSRETLEISNNQRRRAALQGATAWAAVDVSLTAGKPSFLDFRATARLDVLRQNHAAADAEGTINAKTTMPNKI
jgi:hypothetical protein